MAKRTRAREVHKIGGASLADTQVVRHALGIIGSRKEAPPVVVVSAMAGEAGALLALASEAVSGKREGGLLPRPPY